MTDSTRQHLIRYPNCRTSTVVYLRKRDETTDLLRQEIGMQAVQRPAHVSWWRRLLAVLSSQEPKQ
jgi:hypothetical protein